MPMLTGTLKMQVVLDGTDTTSRITVSGMDCYSGGNIGFTQLSVANGATPVDICAAVTAPYTTRVVDHIKYVCTTARTATFSINDGTAEKWDEITLAVGDVFEWAPSGAFIKDSSGAKKYVMPGYLPLSGGTISGATTFSAALTYGGVTLSNAVTGTGNMVLSASPTLTGTLTAAIANYSGLLTANAGISVAASQALTGTVANSTISGFLSVAATTGTFTNVGGTLSTAAQPNVTSVGTLTGLTVSDTISSTKSGSILSRAGVSTDYHYFTLQNTGNAMYFGTEGSAAGAFLTGSSAYDSFFIGTSGIAFSANGGSGMQMRLSSTGLAVTGTLSATGILSTTDATDATSATAASLKTAGGIASVKSAWIGAALRVVTGFGCNGTAPQTAYASGGALSAYGAGANGFDSGANASALHAMVVSIRAALVANGILS